MINITLNNHDWFDVSSYLESGKTYLFQIKSDSNRLLVYQGESLPEDKEISVVGDLFHPVELQYTEGEIIAISSNGILPNTVTVCEVK